MVLRRVQRLWDVRGQVLRCRRYRAARRRLAATLDASGQTAPTPLGEVAQIVGLAQLMATVGEHRGHRWHQARLLVTEHGENGPLEVLQRLQESFERRLILLAQPATAKRQSRRQLANAPNLWLTA